MLTVTFAFVVATTLLLTFKSTRSIGVVGIFILLCVMPVLASVLLILAGFVGYFLFGKPSWSDIRRKLPWGD